MAAAKTEKQRGAPAHRKPGKGRRTTEPAVHGHARSLQDRHRSSRDPVYPATGGTVVTFRDNGCARTAYAFSFQAYSSRALAPCRLAPFIRQKREDSGGLRELQPSLCCPSPQLLVQQLHIGRHTFAPQNNLNQTVAALRLATLVSRSWRSFCEPRPS